MLDNPGHTRKRVDLASGARSRRFKSGRPNQRFLLRVGTFAVAKRRTSYLAYGLGTSSARGPMNRLDLRRLQQLELEARAAGVNGQVERRTCRDERGGWSPLRKLRRSRAVRAGLTRTTALDKNCGWVTPTVTNASLQWLYTHRQVPVISRKISLRGVSGSDTPPLACARIRPGLSCLRSSLPCISAGLCLEAEGRRYPPPPAPDSRASL